MIGSTASPTMMGITSTAMTMDTTNTDKVQEAYIAYYGRPADPGGLAHWVSQLDRGVTFDVMLQSFGASEEAVTLFGNKTNEDTVKTLFQQILGRTPDTGGLLFYAGKLEDGSMTGITIAQNVFDGATGSDATMVANKLAVAKAFNTSLNTAEKKAAYAGADAVVTLREMLATVDSSSDAASFEFGPTIQSLVTAAAEHNQLGTSDFNLTNEGFGVQNYGVAWADYNRRHYEDNDFVNNHISFVDEISATSTIITQNLTYVINEAAFRQNFSEITYSNGAWGYQVFTSEDLNYLSKSLDENDNSLVYFTSLMGDDGAGRDGAVLGHYDVEDTESFFAAFKTVMLQHASIAEKIGADLFIMGQELALYFNSENRLSWGYQENWEDVLDSMREVYSGNITYGAHFGVSHTNPSNNSNEALKLSFGNSLDAIGIDMYAVEPVNVQGELTYETITVEEMIRLWARLPDSEVSPVQELRKIHDLWGLPIVITETARMSGRYIDGTSEYDENFFDFQGQANKYHADLFVLNVYLGDIDISYPALPYQHEYRISSQDNYSANINNKPSEDVIKYFYSGGFYEDDLEVLILSEFEFATGFNGDDRFIVESFSEIQVHGGQGNDELVFTNVRDAYTLYDDADNISGTITDNFGNTINFLDVEVLVFADTSIII